tara:strand:+ start:981 stop:1259 length:279 start_codon:yes stop_codon:yes gene_type:complete
MHSEIIKVNFSFSCDSINELSWLTKRKIMSNIFTEFKFVSLTMTNNIKMIKRRNITLELINTEIINKDNNLFIFLPELINEKATISPSIRVI